MSGGGWLRSLVPLGSRASWTLRPRAADSARVSALVVVAATLLVPAVVAQSRIQTSVDTTLITVGDRVTLTVSVLHAPDARVVWPDSLTLAPFEALGATVLPPRTEPDGVVSSAVFSITAFELGELEIPSFEVGVVGPDGSEPEILETDRFGVEVVTVGADESGDIREIRGPLWIPVSVLGLLLLGLLVLLPALGAYLLYRRFRSRPGDVEVERGPPPRPAHEVALEALAALEAAPMLARGQVKEFHIEVSEILRTYVERRFEVDALEMTTTEVLAGLRDAGVDEAFRSGLGDFLDQCDLVKFAKVRPAPERSKAVLALGRRLVEASIPVAPPAAAEAADASGVGEGRETAPEALDPEPAAHAHAEHT